jgi:hypothetical protein
MRHEERLSRYLSLVDYHDQESEGKIQSTGRTGRDGVSLTTFKGGLEKALQHNATLKLKVYSRDI